MAVFMQSNDISVERTGVAANVPQNDVARLMYYLNCVCVSIDCNHDPDMQRFTNYHNWARLSVEEQKALLVLCYTFSPDIFEDRVFFQNDVLCVNSSNEFYTLNQVRNQILAAESIVIAGQQRVVNKIMTYKMVWMKTYYIDPMQRLVARFSAPPSPPRPAVTHTSPTYGQQPSSRAVARPKQISQKRMCTCKCCSIVIVILILLIVGAGVGAYFILKQKGIL